MPDPQTQQQSGLYPEVSFYFRVKVGGEAYPFKEVSGLSVEMDTQELREGGENSFVYRIPKGVKQSNLTLKGCLLPSGSTLYTWCVSVLQDCVFPLSPKSVEVQLLDPDGNPVRSWSLYNAFPVKWEIDRFDALENKVAVESIVLCYTQMIQNNAKSGGAQS